jgi:hypothetical protein
MVTQQVLLLLLRLPKQLQPTTQPIGSTGGCDLRTNPSLGLLNSFGHSCQQQLRGRSMSPSQRSELCLAAYRRCCFESRAFFSSATTAIQEQQQ